MQNARIGLFILLSTLCAGLAVADGTVEYAKKNAVVEVERQGKQVRFSINSSVGQHACSLDGTAIMMQANQAAYTSDDMTDRCVALLTFKSGSLTVTTKDCDGSCGMNAVGSMDGLYKPSVKKK
jgi:hypothetical protein